MVVRLAVAVVLLLTTLGGCNYRANLMPGPRTVPATSATVMPASAPGSGIFGWLPDDPGTPQVQPHRIAATPPYTLDSGDRLRIVVFGEEYLTRSYSVDGSGYISMPLIGAVVARGVSTFELERRIAEQLKVKYVKDPKVSVEVELYRPFFVLGEVRKPGQYPYVNSMTVQTAVAIAGGFTERARERLVEVTRREGGRIVTVEVPGNAPVMPGDTVYVPERFF